MKKAIYSQWKKLGTLTQKWNCKQKQGREKEGDYKETAIAFISYNDNTNKSKSTLRVEALG